MKIGGGMIDGKEHSEMHNGGGFPADIGIHSQNIAFLEKRAVIDLCQGGQGDGVVDLIALACMDGAGDLH